MELYSGVLLIEGLNKGKFPYCNVLKVRKILIDAGAGIEIVKGIYGKVDILLLSHTHPDHASGAWIFEKKVTLAPSGFKTDLDSLANRFAGEIAEVWKRFVTNAVNMKSFSYKGYSDGILFEDPEIEAIPVLGHSADHHAFLIEQKILFGSDVDLTSFGPFYGNPESDPYLFKKEISKLLDLDFEIFVPSHSKPVFSKDEAVEKMVRFMEKFEERERKILDILEEPRKIEEIVEMSPIYGRKPYAKEMLDFFEKNMVMKHIEKLLKDRKIKKDGEYYVRR